MSTKTAFKRVALVAAAALAFGGISAVSAQASVPGDWTAISALNSSVIGSSATAETATQIAGVANYVALTDANDPVYIVVTGGTIVGGTTAASVAATTAVNIATPTVGTITVTSYKIVSGAASTTATGVLTISVVAAVAGTVYGSSTVFGGTGATPVTVDGTFPIVASAITAAVAANFTLVELDNLGGTLNTGYKAITATATNGLLTSTVGLSQGPTTYISGIPGGARTDFALSSIAGLAGTSTVTFSVNGVVVKTYAVTFTGAAVKIVLTAVNPVIAVGTAVAEATAGITANTNALEIQEFDANQNAVAVVPGTITVTSAATATATAGAPSIATGSAAVNFLGGTTSGTALSSTVAGVSLAGVAAGTTTFTATDSTGTLTSLPVTVRVSSAVPTTVVYSTDASSYSAGQGGKLTVTVSDAVGTLPAGVYTLATGAATASYAFAVAPTNLPALITLDDSGVSTAAFNAPLSDGSVTVGGTSTTAVTVTPATFTVVSGASDAANAATDAANEATDAANAATDAANAAADSADAATQAAQDAGAKADAALAAVTALSQQVTSVLAKVAGLAALLARIVKKVKA